LDAQPAPVTVAVRRMFSKSSIYYSQTRFVIDTEAWAGYHRGDGEHSGKAQAIRAVASRFGTQHALYR
jgi:hypothetical protein